MSEKFEIQNPIEIKDNSKERVAFDLANLISSHEKDISYEQKDRKYWLTLYYQCLLATSDRSLKSILKAE